MLLLRNEINMSCLFIKVEDCSMIIVIFATVVVEKERALNLLRRAVKWFLK